MNATIELGPVMGKRAAAEALGLSARKLSSLLRQYPEAQHGERLYPGHVFVNIDVLRAAIREARIEKKKRSIEWSRHQLEKAEVKAVLAKERAIELQHKVGRLEDELMLLEAGVQR